MNEGGAAGLAKRDAPLGALRRLVDAHGRRLRPARDAAVQLAHAAEEPLPLEVAGHDEDRVVRGVVGSVVAVEVVPRHRPQVVLVAEHAPAVRVLAEGGRAQLLAEQVAGVVLGSLALGDDDGALALDLGGVEERVGHAVGLDAQAQVVGLGGQGLEVGREVVVGEAVVHAAVLGDLFEDFALAELAAALEEHVLDPVRCPREAEALVARADAIPGPDGDDGGRVALDGEHLQPVVERGLLDAEGRRAVAHRLTPSRRGARLCPSRRPSRGCPGAGTCGGRGATPASRGPGRTSPATSSPRSRASAAAPWGRSRSTA